MTKTTLIESYADLAYGEVLLIEVRSKITINDKQAMTAVREKYPRCSFISRAYNEETANSYCWWIKESRKAKEIV